MAQRQLRQSLEDLAETMKEEVGEAMSESLYVLEIHRLTQRALTVSAELARLAAAPRPDSLTWQYETTGCMEQVAQIKAELTATHPPESLSDKKPELMDAIDEAALDFLRSLTRCNYLLLDYAHAKGSGDEIGAGVYLVNLNAERERLSEAHEVLRSLLDRIYRWPPA